MVSDWKAWSTSLPTPPARAARTHWPGVAPLVCFPLRLTPRIQAIREGVIDVEELEYRPPRES